MSWSVAKFRQQIEQWPVEGKVDGILLGAMGLVWLLFAQPGAVILTLWLMGLWACRWWLVDWRNWAWQPGPSFPNMALPLAFAIQSNAARVPVTSAGKKKPVIAQENRDLSPEPQANPPQKILTLAHLLEQAGQIVMAEAGWVFLLDDHSPYHGPLAQWPLPDSEADFVSIPGSGELVELAAQSGLPQSDSQTGIIALPLIVAGQSQPVGVVMMARPTPFTPAEVQHLLDFATTRQLADTVETHGQIYRQVHRQWQRRVDELAGLQRISDELSSTLDLRKILETVQAEIRRVTQAPLVNIYFFDAAADILVLYQPLESSEQPLTLPVQAGIMGRCLRLGQSILIDDVSTEPEFVDLGYHTQSKAVAPIIFGEETIGVINLESPRLNFFNHHQLRYLEALVKQAAIAIGNAYAYQQQIQEREQASRRAEQLARLSELINTYRTNRPLNEILEDIVFAIAESVGYDVAMISLIQGLPPTIRPEVGAGIPLYQLHQLQNPALAKPLENLNLAIQPRFKLSQSYFIPVEAQGDGWLERLNIPYFEKGLPQTGPAILEIPAFSKLLPRRSEWQSGDMLIVPLTNTAGQLIGMLTVANPIDGLRPTEPTIKPLETFANHAASAIENAHLFEMEKERRELANTLRGVAEAISSQLEFEELLNIVLEELSRVVDYSGANVQLLEGEQMVVIGSRGQENHRMTVGDTLSIHTATPIRQVIENQEPLIINDTRRDYADFFAQPNHRHIGSWLGVPLTYGINILGVMTLNKNTDNFFTPDHMEVILAFANQVAVALQNARLFDEARQQVRQLAALTEVAQSLNRALDLNEVLNLVLDAVFELVGNHKGSVWLVDVLSQTVKMADTKNVPGFLVELFNESHVSLTSEPFASVIESGEIQVLQGHNIKKDNAINYGFPFPADVTYVPLKTESGVIGVLAIETVIHNRNMLKLVTTLADLAAVAIESARLLENTRRHAAEMQNLYNLGVEVTRTLEVRQVMQTVITNTLTLTNSQLGAILFTDDQTGQQLLEWAAPTLPSVKDQSLLWTGLNRQMALTRLPLLLTQADLPDKIGPDPALVTVVKNLGIRAILGVPIFGQSEMNGGLFVASLTAPYFSSQDVQSLSFVATQASVAIRNATSVQRLNQLRQELEDRVALRTEELARTLQDLTEERDRVQTLYQIARELSASFDLDRVLNEALNLINGVIGISQGAILLLNRETGQLVYRAALGRDKALPRGGQPTPYKIGYGLAGAVIEKRQARLVLDLEHDPDWVDTEDDDGGERRSAIAVPLSTGDDVLGVLLLFHPDYGYFTEDHLKLVTAASAQIATTVNNAELYRLITDQAKRLGALYRQQASEAAKNQAILEGITDGVLVLDADGHIVLLNPKGAEILNIQFAQVENQPLSQILPLAENPLEPDLSHLFYHNMQKALDIMQKGQSSAQFRIETGAKAIMVSLAPVALGGEDRPSIVAVLRDITREAEIDRLKNEFISTVSHELRTPMTSIKGYADLLLSGNTRIGALNETQHRFVKVIQSNANRLTELVNDILEISRIETGRIKLEFIALDIAPLIKEVSISFEGQMVQKAMHLTLHLPNDLPTVYADKARLTQILVNLIGNAWQYTPEGGHINVFAKRAGNFVQVDVADTGIGIVEKDIAYIFDRFFRSERTEVQVVDGTGLGLSITKSFVDMIGGEIWVKSKLDVGTTFSFTVPIYQNTEMTLADSTGKAQLLLIEDDPIIVDMLRPKLTQHGYEVVALGNGQDALQFVHDHAGSINAIMLDLALKSSNGVTLLNQLKQNHSTADIPLILTSLLIKAKRKSVSSQIVEVISPLTPDKIITDRVRQQLTRLPKAEGGIDTSPLAELSKGQPAILIIENNRDLSGRLKDLLSAHGYQVQCAFNSQQAVDMIYGNKPALVFLNIIMPEVEQESMLAFLRHNEDTLDIPVVLIADEELLNRCTKLLNQLLWTNNHKSVSRAVADLIIEMRAAAPKN